MVMQYPVIKQFAEQGTVPCNYAMFDRHGGVSRGVYASLNVGENVDDLPLAVQENRERVRATLAIPHILSAGQIHDTNIYCLTEPLIENKEVEGCDALITDQPDVGLMIQQADCQAVLLFDSVRNIIAAVHCGWRGSVQGILPRVLQVMAEKYATAPADVQAVISPSLGPCCAEFINYRRELPAEFTQFMVRENYFDFWRISRHQLLSAGMSDHRIESVNKCTCCSDDYFSYRRANRLHNGLTGRNCSVIALKEKSA